MFSRWRQHLKRVIAKKQDADAYTIMGLFDRKNPQSMKYVDTLSQVFALHDTSGDATLYPAVQLIPNLWLGSRFHAANPAFLREHNIRHVLNTADTGARGHLAALHSYKCLFADDNNDYPMLAAHFDESRAFLDAATVVGGGILIHCWAGMNRSATIALAYAVTAAATDSSPRDRFVNVLRIAMSVRPVILSNYSFRWQLCAFVEKEFATHTADAAGTPK